MLRLPSPFWLVLMFLLPAGPAGAAMDRALFVSLGASVLRVEAPGRAGYAIGSGVALRPDKVITNCHVTQHAREIFVVRGSERWAAEAQVRDVERDLCLLHVPGLGAPPVPLGRSDHLVPGQTVTAIGFTGGATIQSSVGSIVNLHQHGAARVIQSSNWFSSGASGGGLFDDDGRLVGILTFRLRGGHAHYFSGPVDWAREALGRAVDVDFEPVQPAPASGMLPFWQDGAPMQPPYLKAAVLQRDARWAELETMAVEWSRSEPAQAEPWATLGTALERQGRFGEARSALECSLRLAPEDPGLRRRVQALASRESAAAAPDRPTHCLSGER